jgi:DUF4097 and DUF4098 domain-containing protein YvlB
MTSGRLVVRTVDGASGVSVKSVTAKLATDARAVAAAAAVTMQTTNGQVRIQVPEAPGRGRSPQVLVEVHVPVGADVSADAGEAEVVCVGRVRDLTARTTSGSVHAEQIDGRLDVRSGRGPVTVHLCRGPSEIAVADAGVIVRAAEGPLTVRGRSADIHVWWLAAAGQLSTSTGNVRIGWDQTRPVALDLQTGAGRLDVAVPDDPAAEARLRVRTIAGDIRVTPARRP